MPKIKTKLSNKLQIIVKEMKEFTTDGNVLFCSLCCKTIAYDSKHGADRLRTHIQSLKHCEYAKNANINKQKMISECLDTASSSQSIKDTFNKDLTACLVEANIPLYKVNHPSVKKFLTKYTTHHVPDESTLRKFHVKVLYDTNIANIKMDIGEDAFYLIIDESTDVEQRYILNILIGKLNGEFSKPKLISSKPLETVNGTTVCQAVNSTINELWQEGIKYERLKLVVSDQVPYMIKAVRNLKCFYPSIHHVTCLVHALHRVCETIREEYKDVNDLVSSIKSILSKSPYRRQLYKSITDLPLPPDVVVTRWGTWLNFCFYLCDNLPTIENFLNELDTTDKNKSINRAQELITNNQVQDDLIYIKKFKPLVDGIKKLQTLGLTIKDQLDIVLKIKDGLTGLPRLKIEYSLSKNPDLLAFCAENAPFEHRSIRTFAPLVSVDVERSFSRHKNILQDNRRSLTTQNLEMLLSINYNNY
jgi:hypothetical protein